MLKPRLKIIFIITISLVILACEDNQKGYPIFLSEGRKVNSEYKIFEIQPRKFIEKEMISIGIDLEGNVHCLGRESEYRLCSQELKDKDPVKIKDPEEPKYPDNYYYLPEEEKKIIKSKIDAWDEKWKKEQYEPYQQILDKQPKLDDNLIVKAVDTNGNEIPFVMAGNGGGYCSKENDNICYQYTLDEENSKIKSLEGVEIKVIKIKTVENTLKVSNIYVVGAYKRSILR